LDLTGPEALAPAGVVAECNAVFGADIALAPMDDGALARELAAAGMAAALVEQAVEMERDARTGRANAVSDVVERLTGRAPQGLRDLLLTQRLDLLLASKRS
jgi:NAD(P)H dehydrogenase (quinone)